MQFDENLIRRPGESWFDAGKRWMMPAGGGFTDGIRLAILNGVLILAALIAGAILGLLVNLLELAIPVPDLVSGWIVALAGLAAGVLLWHRFGAEHERHSLMRTQASEPNLVGVIGAIPFIIVGGMIVIGALVQIFVSSITFNGSGVGSGLLRLLLAAAFLGVAAAVVFVVRVGARS